MDSLLLVSILTLPFFLVSGPKWLRVLALAAFVALIVLNGRDAAVVFLTALVFLPLALVGSLALWAILKWRRSRRPRPRVAAPARPPEVARAVLRDEPPIAAPESESGERGVIEEEITVVLRRQIPVRFDEPPRSWLGGCPMMPERIPWPTSPSAEFPDDGEVYLHFVAQIACADLPAQLWGGLGPRTGWLLLFLDAQSPNIDDPPSTLQVLHIDELGPERPPPDGTRPMRNEDYTGYSFDFYPSADEVPSLWRRWPLDLVTFPNDLEPGLPEEEAPDQEGPEEEDEDAPTPMTPATPYDGAKVDPHYMPIYAGGAGGWETARPFCWQGTLYVVDSVIRAVVDRKPLALSPQDRALFEDPSWPERLLDVLQGGKTTAAKRIASYERILKAESDPQEKAKAQERLQQWRLRLASYRESEELFQAHRSAEGLLELRAKVEASMAAFNDWVADRFPDLMALRAEVLDKDLDSALWPDDFRPIFDRLAAMKTGCLQVIRDDSTRAHLVHTIETSLLDWARRGFGAALGEAATDLYARSARARAAIPADLLKAYEPKWRHVARPHRMGGWHDGLHSKPSGEPSRRVLLFQIGADNAMQWSWGDVGAYFVFIEGADLAAGRFDRLQWWHENH